MSTAPRRSARYGERLALRRLALRHADRVGLLATLVGRTPAEAQHLAGRALVLARRDGGRFDDALTRAFSRLTVTLPDPLEARGRLALLLVDVERRRPREAADLLGMQPDELAEVLATVRRAHPERPCRGWGLASRRPGLTEAELAAGDAHLELCRRCRERLASVERVRAQVLGGSAGVVGAVAGAQLLPWSGAATGTLVTGKAATGVVGLLGAAVLATGGAAVATDYGQPDRPTPPPVTRAEDTPSPDATPQRPVAPASPPPSVVPGPTPTDLPLPVPSALPTAVPEVPVPTLPLPQLPVVPLPSLPVVPQLPLPLPTPLQRLLDLR